jgi:monovalent cation:H+ antiporter, CPA1 family
MRPFELIAILIVLTAMFGYVNIRLLKLPSTIGLMALSLVFSITIVVVGSFVPAVEHQARAVARQFELDQALLHGMLGFLLFAGALHVDLGDLSDHKWPIAVMVTLGVLISTVIIGGLTWVVLGLFGLHLRPIDCLLFGALISPTDPIAVLALLKQIGAPKPLEIQIAGESLFNDGVGVVVFLGLLDIATGHEQLNPGFFVELFVREAIGGALFGLAIGLLTYRLLKSVDHYRLEILLSLALVAGGYALAEALEISAPIAMVVAGLLIGNHGRSFAMSETTTEHIDRFWGLLDEFLNAVLFVMIGMEVLVLIFTTRYLLAGLAAVAIVLLARLVSVGVPVWLLRRGERFEPSMIPMLTWGGLRGGISVALALSLPEDLDGTTMPSRDIILAITYVVVVFSILVQGLTIGWMSRLWLSRERKIAEVVPIPVSPTEEDRNYIHFDGMI